MKDNEIIKACAELDGYEYHGIVGFQYDGATIEWTKWTKGGEVSNGVPSYLTSYDAIIPLIQKQDVKTERRIAEWLIGRLGGYGAITRPSPATLCQALLRATGKWKE